MDRQTIYPGQVPLETDLLKTNQNVMVGLAKLSEAIFGTGGVAAGFATTQTVVPSLAVLIAPGEVYDLQNLESTAISSLPQDLAHSIVKQGVMLNPLTLPVTAPATPGFSVNYLVQVAYQDVDSGATVLPYYNASNPSVAYSGPANSGAAQPTARQGVAAVNLKAGTAATTGTQATPAPDAGKYGLYVITVANGQASVTNSNIAPYPSAPVLQRPVYRGPPRGLVSLTTSQSWVVPPGVYEIDREVWGGGGGSGGVGSTGNGSASGGGGGGYTRDFLSVTPGQVFSAVIGAPGAAGAAGQPGGAGGTTTFGTLSATGGAGGTANSIGSGGAGGTGSGGLINAVGASGSGGVLAGQTGAGGVGGGSPYGGLGGGGALGTGGSGVAPGGGGGGPGSSAAQPGAVGARGQVNIRY